MILRITFSFLLSLSLAIVMKAIHCSEIRVFGSLFVFKLSRGIFLTKVHRRRCRVGLGLGDLRPKIGDVRGPKDRAFCGLGTFFQVSSWIWVGVGWRRVVGLASHSHSTFDAGVMNTCDISMIAMDFCNNVADDHHSNILCNFWSLFVSDLSSLPSPAALEWLRTRLECIGLDDIVSRWFLARFDATSLSKDSQSCLQLLLLMMVVSVHLDVAIVEQSLSNSRHRLSFWHILMLLCVWMSVGLRLGHLLQFSSWVQVENTFAKRAKTSRWSYWFACWLIWSSHWSASFKSLSTVILQPRVCVFRLLEISEGDQSFFFKLWSVVDSVLPRIDLFRFDPILSIIFSNVDLISFRSAPTLFLHHTGSVQSVFGDSNLSRTSSALISAFNLNSTWKNHVIFSKCWLLQFGSYFSSWNSSWDRHFELDRSACII